MGGFLEMHNDMYVLWCSYMVFCFTAFALTPVNKEVAGWLFVGAVALMALTNITILLVSATKRGLNNLKIKFAQMKQKRDR
jgi:hypothetical protein